MKINYLVFTISLLIHLTLSGESILNKNEILSSFEWLENRDYDWYASNIPFIDTPNKEIDKTYYYRWELVTRHLCYGSPNTGYIFTEFANRPFWSGRYGAISCPSGHQFNEIRWLNNSLYARDYLKYWFKTEGAQPRKYSSWLAYSALELHKVQPDKNFIVGMLDEFIKNYSEWEKKHWVEEAGMFWQTGHDDGMEFNIASRQTKNILAGDKNFRPSFNSYMWADAKAIAEIATLDNRMEVSKKFHTKANNIKGQIQNKLWDPKRNFFFPMSSEKQIDKDGNVIEAHTLTYQSGKHAGNMHGRELHGYTPWLFNLPDKGYEKAWSYLMKEDYFKAPYGPTTVERNDPMFLLQTGCCWWSGQSWPFATAQTLKSMANLLQNYSQKYVDKNDYLTLLNTFAISHRKNGRPYIAEALHPDTGSWRGHDMYNRSEHYFHSSFNDLIITGLFGVIPQDDNSIKLSPLIPESWDYCLLDDLSYKGRKLTILWDKNGNRYQKGKGFKVFYSGKLIFSSSSPQIVKLILKDANDVIYPKNRKFNYAVNNDGDYYPRAEVSFISENSHVNRLQDGQFIYDSEFNQWTTEKSKDKKHWIEMSFGTLRPIDTVKLYFLENDKLSAPASYKIYYKKKEAWQEVAYLDKSPITPKGKMSNTVKFRELMTEKIKIMFECHEKPMGLTEIEAWGKGSSPYVPAPPAKGNLALKINGSDFPKITASHHDKFGGIPSKANDGKIIFQPNPMNRWTSFGSENDSDWLELDFGRKRKFNRIDLYIYDDKGGVQAPKNIKILTAIGDDWLEITNTVKSPKNPQGGSLNRVQFDEINSDKIRIIFIHKKHSKSGLTELEVWHDKINKKQN